ncbi:hypothetical protein QAD02_002875 [Eretmocerus hayati]|uniref:Uncharacterized protein n=1 Tax=Eretmocerus hayati TaxID=131215 RepID=A0ACC2NKJ3_9HYME|nr:hypothetical protein QAD02_002875 [Eretmocerus hayati]
MDEKTQQLLTQWGFGKYIPIFEDEELDFEALRDLTSPLAALLIPKIGARSKFLKAHNDYFYPAKNELEQNEREEDDIESILEGVSAKNTEKTVSENEPQNHQQSSCQVRSWNEVDNDVSRYLKNDIDGLFLFNTYKQRDFTKTDRCKLSRIVIKAELGDDPNKKIDSDRMLELAKQTGKIFPGEEDYFYFIEAHTTATGDRKTPKGPFYNAYVEKGRKLRKAGSRLSLRQSHPQPVLLLAKLDVTSVRAYMDIYQQIAQPWGIFLLEIDFHNVNPNIPKQALSENWEQLVSVVQQYHPEEDLSDDLVVLKLFASLFDPFVINGKGNNSWRPSKAEIVDGFILHVKTISDLESSIKRMQDNLSHVQKTLQPIPIIVKNKSENPLC